MTPAIDKTGVEADVVLQSGAKGRDLVGRSDAEGQVLFSGLVYAGVTQINVVVPSGAPSGIVPLTVNVGGGRSQPGLTASLQ